MDTKERPQEAAQPVVERANADGNRPSSEPETRHEVRPKYRDPKTNDTWTGRGRMPNWLKRKQEAGEDLEEYLV
jgi:DNA-binding protein H-NS